MTEAQFAALCKAHDLSYAYSDDHSVWQRGRDSMNRIVLAAAKLPRDAAARIWNEAVDAKITGDTEYRKQFYWMP